VIAALLARVAAAPALAAIGGVFAWLFGDWRRILALVIVGALIATYAIADDRRAKADAIVLQQRLDVQSKAFITAADAAMRKEDDRQVAAGDAATTEFNRQMAIRDAADAKVDAALKKEIADEAQTRAAQGSICALTDADRSVLRPPAGAPQPAAPKGRR